MWIREQEREKIRPLLQKLREQVEILQYCSNEQANADTCIVNAAMERALHIGCECITDIGNIIIDTCIMRDPSSYTDIVTILQEEQVLDHELGQSLLPIVSYRKHLVHTYMQLDSELTKGYAVTAIPLFAKGAEQIEQYIQNN